jgi:hypothetical protein
MSISDLLQWLGSSGSTGVLTLERNKVSKRIIFRDGHVIACSTDEPSELLGHFLVSRGKISEETLRMALGRQEQSGGHLGAILVEMGALTSEDLTRLLAAKTEETIFSLFDVEEAVFRFEDSDVSGENVSFPVELKVEDILLRGMQRFDEMRQIRTVFNDPGIVLRHTGRPPADELRKSRMAWTIYETINGERTVAEILLHAHASEYLVTKFLFELYRNGFAEIAETREVTGPGPAPKPEPDLEIEVPLDPEPAPSPPPAPSGPALAADPVVAEVDTLVFEEPEEETAAAIPPAAAAVAEPPPAAPAEAPPAATANPAVATSLDADLEVAGNLMSRGEYDAALEILNGTYKAHPGDETLGRLLAEAEACFLEKAYRHYLPPAKIPVLLRPPEELAQEQISPQEYFLLSRIDGTWDVKSIIQVSPIREVDVVRTLKRMREKGFIELRDPD